MPSYMPSSTRLGSTRIMRTCSGVDLKSTLMIMALMATDLPEPVEPAMSTCGMAARSAVTMRPLMSLPSAMASLDLDLRERLALDHVAQPDGLAVVVGDLDADGGFAGHALDQDGLGGHGEAEVVGETGDARVLDAGVGTELEGGDDGAGIDLRDLAIDAELGALLHQGAGFVAQGLLADDGGFVGAVEQRGRRQFVTADGLGRDGDGLDVGVGALAEGDGLRLRLRPGLRRVRNRRRAARRRLRARVAAGRARGGQLGEIQIGAVVVGIADGRGGCGQGFGVRRGCGSGGAQRRHRRRVHVGARHGLPDGGGRVGGLLGGGLSGAGDGAACGACVPTSRRGR